MDTFTRLYSRVRVIGDCMEWTGPRNDRGYGRISLGKRGLHGYAHRLAWELNVGPIPTGMDVCHRCDNPPCVRIDHLFVGTRSDNMRDMEAKGRGVHHVPKGPHHYGNHWTAVA